MPKDKQKAEKVKEDLDAGEEASVSSPEEEKAALKSEVKEETKPVATVEVKPETPEAGEKPTRSERRIQQLLDKLKTVGQQTEQQFGEALTSKPAAVSREVGVETALPWDEQLVPGREYTVDELRGIIKSEVQKGIRQKDEVDKIRTSVKEYADEMEWLMREAPELKDSSFDERLSELIIKINSGEKGEFVPKMSPKEIYTNLLGFMEKARTKAQAETSAKLHESGEMGAVAPGSGKTAKRDYEEEALLDKARETGSNEDWANLIKKRMFGKK